MNRSTMQNEIRKMPGRLRQRAGSAVAALALAAAAAASFAQTATPTDTPAAPPQLIVIPQTPPTTTMQAPLPAPVATAPPVTKPALVSPGINVLTARAAITPITLQDAVAIALSTNRNLAFAREALLRAQGRTSETRAALQPALTGTASYTRLDEGANASLGGQNITLTNINQPNFGLSFTLPLDISGLLHNAISQAQFSEVAARLDVNRTRNQTVLDVKSAFYDVLRAQALVYVATEQLQNSLDRLRDAQLKYAAGTVAQFDVIRAQTDVANAQQQLIQSRSQVSLSVASLNNAMGIDINYATQISSAGAVETPAGVAEPTAVAAPSAAAPNPAPESGAGNAAQPPVPSALPIIPIVTVPVSLDPLELGKDYDTVLAEALRTRPEILESDASIAAAKQGIHLARRSTLPSLALSLNGAYAPNSAGFNARTTSSSATIALSVPFYEGGAARARVEQARADVANAQTNRRQIVDLVTLDVRQTYLTLLQARDRVAVANQALSQARESFRLARVRYNAGVTAQMGVSPLLEVSDAQSALTQAENNQVSALYDYNNSRARLDKAAGRYSYVPNGPGYSAPPPPKTVGK